MPKTKATKRLEALERLERYQGEQCHALANLPAYVSAEDAAALKAACTRRDDAIAYLRTLVDAR